MRAFHVAVTHVVNELADSPAAGAVGRVDLRGREICDGGTEMCGRVTAMASIQARALVGREG